MNAAHLHLIIVHAPIVLVPLAILILLLGLVRRNTTAVWISLTVMLVSSLLAIAANLSGEEAEDIVEKIPQVSERVIEDHEEAAEVALWLTSLMGVGSLLAMLSIVYRPASANGIATVVFILALLSSSSLFYTGYEGGKIRHPEAYDSSSYVQKSSEDHD